MGEAASLPPSVASIRPSEQKDISRSPPPPARGREGERQRPRIRASEGSREGDGQHYHLTAPSANGESGKTLQKRSFATFRHFL